MSPIRRPQRGRRVRGRRARARGAVAVAPRRRLRSGRRRRAAPCPSSGRPCTPDRACLRWPSGRVMVAAALERARFIVTVSTAPALRRRAAVSSVAAGARPRPPLPVAGDHRSQGSAGTALSRPLPSQLVIGVDLGGTKISGCSTGTDRPRSARCRRRRLAGGAREGSPCGRDRRRRGGLGFGVPSRVDARTGVALGSINIPLEDVSISRRCFEERFGLPTGWRTTPTPPRSASGGAAPGRGADDLIMLTLGTGVGGGVVLAGQALPRLGGARAHRRRRRTARRARATAPAAAISSLSRPGTRPTVPRSSSWGAGGNAEQLVERATGGDADAMAALAAIGRLSAPASARS